MNFGSRSDQFREFKLKAGEARDASTVSNAIHTSKYSVLTFLPLALLDQIARLSSFWFLCVVVYEANPMSLDYEPSYSSLVLFALHLMVNLCTAALALRRCMQGEASINAQRVPVWRDGEFVQLRCEDVRVGDCVLVLLGVFVPADIVLLATSNEDGSCYLSTIRTLGESSLELKSAVRETQRMLPNKKSPANFNFDRLDATVSVEVPNSDFLSFSGSIKLRHFPRAVPLKEENFILRGCLIQDQQWVLGLVLYAGRETKYLRNIVHLDRRPTFLEWLLNGWIILSASLVLASSVAGVLLQLLFSHTPLEAADFLRYLNLYHSVVPLGLYVALDLLRLVYACRMRNCDFAVQSNCLVEHLGKVDFVLADKTGTLTQNSLELLAVLVDSRLYSKVPLVLSNSKCEEALTFSDLKREMQHGEQSEGMKRFCECVALCNGVVPMPDGTFRGTSVDDEALIVGATELGFTLCERRGDSVTILIFEECVSYQIVCIQHFKPELNRMRVLVKQEVALHTATFYVKGAYKTLAQMISLDPAERRLLEQQLQMLSENGLRTMVLCCRVIEGEYLSDIESRVRYIQASRSNVEGSLEVLMLELEQNLTFLGVTGVRDTLQEGAAETVSELQAAGVTTWLVSGEGESPTLACARLAGIVPPHCGVLSLRGLKSADECMQRLSKAVDEVLAPDSLQTEPSFALPGLGFETQLALSVDGESLSTAMRSEESKRLLLTLLLSARGVCFFAMRPNHKREAAQLLRRGVRPESSLLAIGHSVSNIAMLLQADVSVALRGEKIVAISDVSVNSFAALGTLILERGRRCSAQLCKATLLFLYSQVILVLSTFTMALLADFTPTCLVSTDGGFLYGAVFAFVPIVCLSAFPRLHEDSTEERLELQQLGAALTWRNLWRYWTLAASQFLALTAILFSACVNANSSHVSSQELKFLYLATMVKAVCVQCLVECSRYWVLHALVQVAAVGSFYAFYAAGQDEGGVVLSVLHTPHLLLGMCGATLACAVLSVAFKKISLLLDVRHNLLRRTGSRSLQPSDLKPYKRLSESLLTYTARHSAEPSKLHRYAIKAGRGTFANTQTERGFQRMYMKVGGNLLWVLSGAVLLQVVAPLLIEGAARQTKSVWTVLKVTLLASTCLLVVTVVFRRATLWLAQCFVTGMILLALALSLFMDFHNSYIFFYATVCLLLFLREKWLTNCIVAVAASAMLLYLEAQQLRVHYPHVVSEAGSVAVQISALVFCAKLSLRSALAAREKYQLIQEMLAKVEQSDTVLAFLLPEFVCHLVKEGLQYAAEDHVSVIFIDICAFDEICSCYSPAELTALLDEVFQRIDELSSSLHVAKIETVGKTYLACAGLRDFELADTGESSGVPHARRALDLAFAVLRNFRMTRLLGDRPLNFKIGICSGPVVAGVVGHHKPQFVLVGDTVNTASRMASSLETPDTVQVSDSTKSLLEHRVDYCFNPRTVSVKGKGIMTTFIVTHTGMHDAEDLSQQDMLRPMRPRKLSRKEGDTSDKDSCQCSSRNVTLEDEEFREQLQHRSEQPVRLGLQQFSLGCAALCAARLFGESATFQVRAAAAGYALLAAAAGGLLLTAKAYITCRVFPLLLGAMYCIGSWLVTLDGAEWVVFTGSFSVLVVCYLLVLVNFATGLLFRHAAATTLLVAGPHLWHLKTCSDLECSLFLLLFALQSCIFLFFLQRAQRKLHTSAKIAQCEIEKTEQLLTHMIPVQAYEGLRQGKWSTDRLVSTTILFADISGFTTWASEKTPAKVIASLSAIFKAFDIICVRMNLFKVCTIGDCYVALSSTSNSEQRDPGEECVRMVEFAFEMARTMEQVSGTDSLRMRIGLHVGEVVAGITGSRIVRYDIYGPDVAVANKMESTGEVGRINISDRTKKLLELAAPDEFDFQPNAKVPQGRAYFVSGKS